MFCFDNPLRFCENIQGRKKCGLCAANSHAYNRHFYPVSEIYAWCGQTPYVMLMTAHGQRSSYHITPIAIAQTTKQAMRLTTGEDSEQ
jgi:hypothetical protein